MNKFVIDTSVPPCCVNKGKKPHERKKKREKKKRKEKRIVELWVCTIVAGEMGISRSIYSVYILMAFVPNSFILFICAKTLAPLMRKVAILVA